ncbi:MAG TPA: TlpA disulfide reductase family protein [Candidatus Eisenbacteria bacterium]|nr:TlpA disulfide reductase family protein [Candidatus Eisenbacteria bacterium]
MSAGGGRWAARDLAAGLIAIVLVVGVSVRATFVGSDLRALFAVTALVFFMAGFARGHDPRRGAALRGLVTSLPGLLGTAALIVNDGTHRLPIPIAVSLTAIAFAIAGVRVRRLGAAARGRAAALALGCLAALALELTQVRSLVTYASFHAVDRAAPPFALATLEGDTLRSADLRGRVVVLAFWASWCLPCRWEMPELEAAYARLAGDRSVVFRAVDAAWGGESRARARRFLTRAGVDLPVAFDAGGAGESLGVHALPTVLLLDRGGRVRFEHYGFDRSERVGEVIVRGVRALQREPAR